MSEFKKTADQLAWLTANNIKVKKDAHAEEIEVLYNKHFKPEAKKASGKEKPVAKKTVANEPAINKKTTIYTHPTNGKQYQFRKDFSKTLYWMGETYTQAEILSNDEIMNSLINGAYPFIVRIYKK